MTPSEWRVSPRHHLRYRLERVVYWNALGTYYEFYRDASGRVLNSWTKRTAQQLADTLNKEPT